MAALDSHSKVWIFNHWGSPYRLASSTLDNSSPDARAIQIEAGWEFVAILTESGDVYATWPNFGELKTLIAAHKKPQRKDDEEVIVCETWEVNTRPFSLPQLPKLSVLVGDQAEEQTSPRLVKIAAGQDFVIGLTDKGHVLKIDLSFPANELLEGEAADAARQDFIRKQKWEYVSVLVTTICA